MRLPLYSITPVAAALATLAAALGASAPASAQLLGPTPYLSFADSPFDGGSFSYFHLEDFQDGALNTPGLSASGGIVTSGNDSVESAPNGAQSYYSGGQLTVLTFTFSAAALGTLPTHAGLVWTDVGFSAPTLGFGEVFFEAFDASSASLGVIGPFLLGDGSASPSKPEDRFFGVTNAAGISAIRISMPGSGDWELDHVQYGLVVASSAAPEPGTVALLGLGLLPLALAARRGRKG